jgi:hypothetical protein
VNRRVRVALIGLALLGGMLLVREYYAPRLTLIVQDALWGLEPLTVPLDDGMALRLYADTRPHIGKIAALQKGLALVADGTPLIEEGFGFGAPIVQVGDATYLSRHAETALTQNGEYTTLVKAYTIDVVDRPTRALRKKYQDVAPLGTVVFSYTLRPPETVDVTVDLTGLEADWARVYLMNEQGARAFTRYRDAHGGIKEAGEVGIWQEAAAPFGCWEAPSHGVRFCLDAPAGQPGFVGRERYNQYNWLGIYYLSWSGIDLEVAAPQTIFTYTIRVEQISDVP